jgi:hypothetical protein
MICFLNALSAFDNSSSKFQVIDFSISHNIFICESKSDFKALIHHLNHPAQGLRDSIANLLLICNIQEITQKNTQASL